MSDKETIIPGTVTIRSPFLPVSPDENVNDLVKEMVDRSHHGFRKYGTTTMRTDLTLIQWCQHAKEEALDQAVYLNRVIKELHKIESASMRE